jgi:nucleotide-binding universal stress UspA family protein
MKRPKLVLVGLKTKENLAECVDLACQLADRGASLYLVHVIEISEPAPLDAEIPDLDGAARRILRAGVRRATRNSRRVTTLAPRGRTAGEVLVEELEQRRIELGVFGYSRRPDSGQVSAGATLRHLARHAPCRIIFVIPPPPAEADRATPDREEHERT